MFGEIAFSQSPILIHALQLVFLNQYFFGINREQLWLAFMWVVTGSLVLQTKLSEFDLVYFTVGCVDLGFPENKISQASTQQFYHS